MVKYTICAVYIPNGINYTEQFYLECAYKLYNTKEEAMEAIIKELSNRFPECQQSLCIGQKTGFFVVEKLHTTLYCDVYINPVAI